MEQDPEVKNPLLLCSNSANTSTLLKLGAIDMSFPLSFHHRFIFLKPNSPKLPILHLQRSKICPPKRPAAITVTAKFSQGGGEEENEDHYKPISAQPAKPRWETMLSFAASLYPVYVTVGGAVACVKPSAFAWFVERGPTSYSCALGFIMLAMGLTLEFREFLTLLRRRSFSIFFGCAAQYVIMPAIGLFVGKVLGLPSSLAVGLILLSCCPGGTASNVVTLIAQGDVALSIVMTACTTLIAVILTPLLTKMLAGAIIPVDAVGLSISTLQVVVAPILLGSYLQNTFPSQVRSITPFAPLLAVLASSLLACSVFSENVVRLKSSLLSTSNAPEIGQFAGIQGFLSGDLGLVMLSVVLLHFLGFFVGYLSAAICGFGERQRRAISIEVGMQNSSLGVVLATSHFISPLVALPCAMSAVIMNIMGSSLGFVWRYMNTNDNEAFIA